ncbi:hypothetical protein SAMN05216302_101126 [Nitrosomonas aestuarii]|uniref:Uncharacterized protein n=1 Tax=Nitrosomonas aestuarii TaxID=52441 RepID=A0A1I4B5J3_9PROT|nr:hypothetical protein [Nitrosomonas aestuarii]SFK63630.1 hypothetical protein SAMN05216302_101126 [Nitrosomonas aestuarii]
MKTVNSDHAFKATLAFLKKNPWLIEPGKMIDGDESSEPEAIMFIYLMVTEDVYSYDDARPSVQRVVCQLLFDFIAKLVYLEHPLHKKLWTVDQSLPLHLQALQIIVAEIADIHSHNINQNLNNFA